MTRKNFNIYSATTSDRIDCGPGIRAAQGKSDPWEKPGNLIAGSAIHEAIANYIKFLVRHDMRSDEGSAPKFLEAALNNHPAHPSLEARLRHIWGRWVRNFYCPTREAVEGVELGTAVHWSGKLAPFDVDLLDHDSGDKPRAARMGWLLRAAMDFVYWDDDGVLVVKDWKSGAYVPPESVLQKMRQAEIYPGLVALTLGVAPDTTVAFVWHSLPWGEEVRVEVPAMRAMDNLYAWTDTHRRLERLSPDDPYWTTHRRTKGCGVCSKKSSGCPEWSGDSVSDPDSDRPVADTEWLAGELKASRAELRERLYDSPEGSVIIDGGHQARLEKAVDLVSDGGRFLEWLDAQQVELNPEWLSVRLDKVRRKSESKGLVGRLGKPWDALSEELIEAGVLKRRARYKLVIEHAPGLDPAGSDA